VDVVCSIELFVVVEETWRKAERYVTEGKAVAVRKVPPLPYESDARGLLVSDYDPCTFVFDTLRLFGFQSERISIYVYLCISSFL